MAQPCPPPALFEALLAGALSAEEEDRLAGHLDGCPRCRRALDDREPVPTARRLPSNTGLEHLLRALPAELASEAEKRPLPQPPPLPNGAVSDAKQKRCGGGHFCFAPLIPSGSPLVTTDAVQLPIPPPRAGEAAPGERMGRYEVLETVGRGGMGLVLKAYDASLHRLVAIKVLAPHLANSVAARARFAREARAAAAVRHEHVVAIHGVEEQGGQPYLVMEYVPGISLQDRLDSNGALALEEVLRIGTQVASGLAAAHAQGLIHRDIKPGNILLMHGLDQVKITDFGLARAVDDASLTQSGVIAGTPLYMAPEQARGEPLDHRADLFSLGSVLYAMCVGRPPFRASSSLALLRRISEDTPRPANAVNPDVPDWLARVIAVLHAKDPARRFASADEVAGILGQCLAHLQHPGLAPHLPRLPHPGESRRPLARRSLLGAGGLLLTAVATHQTWYWFLRPAAGQPDRPPAESATGPLLRFRAAPGHPVAVGGAAFAPGGEVLATAGDDRAVRIWDLAPVQPRAVLVGHAGPVSSVAYSPDGQSLASAGGRRGHPQDPGELKLWDATTGLEARELRGHRGPVFCVAFAPRGRTLASAGFDGTVRLWDAADGREVRALRGHTGPVGWVAFSPAGHTLASAGFDGCVKLWDAGGACLATFRGANCRYHCVAFSPEGQTLAAAENPAGATEGGPGAAAAGSLPHPEPAELPGRVRLWDVPRRCPRATLEGFKGWVLTLAFHPDGHTLVTGGGARNRFGEVILWDVRSGARQLTLHGHRAWVRGVAFSPGGRTLVSAGGVADTAGEVKLWEVLPR